MFHFIECQCPCVEQFEKIDQALRACTIANGSQLSLEARANVISRARKLSSKYHAVLRRNCALVHHGSTAQEGLPEALREENGRCLGTFRDTTTLVIHRPRLRENTNGDKSHGPSLRRDLAGLGDEKSRVRRKISTPGDMICASRPFAHKIHMPGNPISKFSRGDADCRHAIHGPETYSTAPLTLFRCTDGACFRDSR